MIGTYARAKTEYPPEPDNREVYSALEEEIDWAAIADAIRGELPSARLAEEVDEQSLLDIIRAELIGQGILRTPRGA